MVFSPQPLKKTSSGYWDAALAAIEQDGHSPIEEIGVQAHNYLLRIGDDVCRFATDDWNAKRFVTEADILKHISNRCALKTPEILDFSVTPTFMRYRYIEGVSLRSLAPGTLSAKQREKICLRLVEFLVSLHGIEYPGDQAIQIDRTLGKRLIGSVIKLAQKYRDAGNVSEVIRPIKDFFVGTLDRLPEIRWDAGSRVLLHHDFSDGNVLVEKETLEPAGVVDFTLSWWGDQHWDFRKLRAFLSDEEVTMMVSRYRDMTGREFSFDTLEILERVEICNTYRYAAANKLDGASIRNRILNWAPYPDSIKSQGSG